MQQHRVCKHTHILCQSGVTVVNHEFDKTSEKQESTTYVGNHMLQTNTSSTKQVVKTWCVNKRHVAEENTQMTR